MTHKTKRENNGQTEMDTTMMSLAQKESAYYRKCSQCNRKGAICKYKVEYFYVRICRYCGYMPNNSEKEGASDDC